MAVPKKRTSSARRDKRRTHDKLKAVNVSFDKVSGEPGLAHHILYDGSYNGVMVLKKKEKKADTQREMGGE